MNVDLSAVIIDVAELEPESGFWHRLLEGTPQQMHLDLATDDLAAADRLALEAGARRLQPTDDVNPASQNGGRVSASPAGHPFCLRSA